MIAFVCPDCGEEMEISERMAGKKVACAGCGERLIVPDGGPEPEREAPPGPRTRKQRSSRRADLRAVALDQKVILFCVAAYLLAVAAQFFVPEELRTPLFVGVLLVGATAAVFVFRLGMKLYGTAGAVAVTVLTLIPLIGLLVLLVVNQRATGMLKTAGYDVGLLGASLSDFD